MPRGGSWRLTIDTMELRLKSRRLIFLYQGVQVFDLETWERAPLWVKISNVKSPT